MNLPPVSYYAMPVVNANYKRAEIPKLHNLYFITQMRMIHSYQNSENATQNSLLFDTHTLNPCTLPDAAKEGPKGTWAVLFFPSLL